MSELLVLVEGVPKTQGSMVSYGRGRMAHSDPNLLPWRYLIAAKVREGMREEHHLDDVWPLMGPVDVRLDFWLPRPKSAPKRRLYPEVKPDLDKLVRAVLDALVVNSGAGAIGDDAQVVSILASKYYGTNPGVQIRISPTASQ